MNWDLNNLWGSYANNLPSATLDNAATSSNWWQSFTGGLNQLATGAAPIVGAITGANKTPGTPVATAGTLSLGSIFKSPLVIIVGGVVLLLVLFLVIKRK